VRSDTVAAAEGQYSGIYRWTLAFENYRLYPEAVLHSKRQSL